VDGSEQLTGLQGLGNGTGEDQDVRWAGVASPTIPVRDARRDFPDLTGAALQAATNAAMAAEASPLVQWSVGAFHTSDEWSAEHAAPGRAWRLSVRGDVVVPDGDYAIRVIAASGGLGRTIKTEVQSAA